MNDFRLLVAIPSLYNPANYGRFSVCFLSPGVSYPPVSTVAKSSKIYSHILGIAIFFWLFYCRSRYILAKPHICIYVRGLAKIFWLRKNGYIEWIQHVSTYRGPEYRTSGRVRTKTRSRKKNKVVGLKVRCCVGAVFD